MQVIQQMTYRGGNTVLSTVQQALKHGRITIGNYAEMQEKEFPANSMYPLTKEWRGAPHIDISRFFLSQIGTHSPQSQRTLRKLCSHTLHSYLLRETVWSQWKGSAESTCQTSIVSPSVPSMIFRIPEHHHFCRCEKRPLASPLQFSVL